MKQEDEPFGNGTLSDIFTPSYSVERPEFPDFDEDPEADMQKLLDDPMLKVSDEAESNPPKEANTVVEVSELNSEVEEEQSEDSSDEPKSEEAEVFPRFEEGTILVSEKMTHEDRSTVRSLVSLMHVMEVKRHQ